MDANKAKSFVPSNVNKKPQTGLQMSSKPFEANKGSSENKKSNAKNENSAQHYAEMDDAIVSVDAPTKPSNSGKNAKDQIFDGFGGPSVKKPVQKQNRNERELTKTNWIDSAAPQMSLNDLADTKYDQFANKKSTYSESQYTTTYNIKDISKEKRKYAEKIQREINAADSKGNVHLAEERNQIQLRDNDDEEILYSGVVREKKVHNFKNHKKFSGFKKTKVLAKSELFTKIDKCVEHGPKSNHKNGVLNDDTWRSFNEKGDKVKPQVMITKVIFSKLQQPHQNQPDQQHHTYQQKPHKPRKQHYENSQQPWQNHGGNQNTYQPRSNNPYYPQNQ